MSYEDPRHRHDPEQWARMRHEVPAFIEDVVASAVRGFRRGWSTDRPHELPAGREGLIVPGEQAVGRPMEPGSVQAEPRRAMGSLSRTALFALLALLAVVVVFALGIAFSVLGFVFSLLSAIFGLLSGVFGVTSGVLGATSGLFGALKALLIVPFIVGPILAVVFLTRGRRRRRVKIKEYY